MIPKSGYRFSDKIMLQHKLERDDDSKKSHHALDFSESGRNLRDEAHCGCSWLSDPRGMRGRAIPQHQADGHVDRKTSDRRSRRLRAKRARSKRPADGAADTK